MSDWVFYTTSLGRHIVRDEINKMLPKRGAAAPLVRFLSASPTTARSREMWVG